MKHNAVVCTLFEGDYHYGVAVLVNSLYENGYRGAVFAGYRGTLPYWTSAAKENTTLLGAGGTSLHVADDLVVHFIPVATDYHLTNFKPDFMMQLISGPAKNCSSVYYFDPDIVVCGPWRFFVEWVQCGIALCEDVNSPLPRNHPRRAAWRQYFGSRGIALQFRSTAYANGGYLGLRSEDYGFLELWRRVQETMAPAIGGLQCSALKGEPLLAETRGPFSPFGKTDQDALNAAVEAWNGEVSFIGQEGMSIKSGAALMPHALGQPKPWRWKPLVQALAGRPPRVVDKQYWRHASGALSPYAPGVIRRMLFLMKVGALIGRFYRRR